MRWILSSVLILIATPAFAQVNEAEKLFREMEKTIKEAKSLKVTWEGELAGPGKSAKIKGAIHFAEGNKARIEASGDTHGFPLLRVSDGRQVATSTGNGPVTTKPMQSKSFGTTFVSFLSSMGASIALGGMSAMEEKEGLEINKELSFSNFKLGEKARIGERDVQVVEFEMADNRRGGANKSNIRLWIDPRTLTPLKREMRDAANPRQNFMNETYTEFIINPQLGPKVFELRKLA